MSSSSNSSTVVKERSIANQYIRVVLVLRGDRSGYDDSFYVTEVSSGDCKNSFIGNSNYLL
ncbi:MAG: hypothetical protein QNJ72_08580 [Pleurocapsa sp. MO_226.B13]|nr:hypothetical protein [Pleurocapsa sp. MO_226.B13]